MKELTRKFKLFMILGLFSMGLNFCFDTSSDNDDSDLITGLLLLSQRSGDGGGVVTCDNDCRIFLTEATYDGNLGGITGADEKCMSDSNKPTNRNSVYKAMIFSGDDRKLLFDGTKIEDNGDKDWVFKASTKYVRIDGSDFGTTNEFKLFSNANGFLGSIDVLLPVKEVTENLWFFTGFSTGGSEKEIFETTSRQCRPPSGGSSLRNTTNTSWTSDNSASGGNWGYVAPSTSRTILFPNQSLASNQSEFNCSGKFHLVCVEQ
ncbi:MAG: DUF1554 domain-containing protein [Leptospira sp.]|nr:DUF1554 domain-containing protein [Leptospira sp.]